MWTWLVTFFGGFKVWDGKYLGKILYITIICLGVIFAYQFISKKTVGNQGFSGKIEGNATCNYYTYRPIFGCGGFVTKSEKK